MASLLVVQLAFEVTLNVEVPASKDTVCVSGETPRVGAAPAWVTVTVTGVRPITVTVMIAVRGDALRLAS
jgi:hypothetical protein